MILDVLIVGAGGNGQSYFMKFLTNNNLKINNVCDRDGLKHMSHPKKIPKKLKIKKIIFLYNNPYDSIQSHYRRRWFRAQANKLGNPCKLNFRNINTIDKYNETVIKYNKDIFGVEHQFINWFKKNNTKIPILFLDFNDVLSKTNIINNFLKKNLDYSLFEIKERAPKENNNEIVINIYDKLYNKIKSLTEKK